MSRWAPCQPIMTPSCPGALCLCFLPPSIPPPSQTEWRLSDAGNGSFFISNHLGHYLGDEPGELYGSSVLCSEHRGKAQRWELSCAGGDYVFLTSYLGKQLSDHEGAVSTENEKGRHEKWLIETGAGEIISLEVCSPACCSVHPTPHAAVCTPPRMLMWWDTLGGGVCPCQAPQSRA